MNSELSQAIFDDLEEQEASVPRPRAPERPKHYSLSKTTSHIQEKMADQERFFKYDNATLEQDRKRYFSLCFAYLKETSEPSLLNLLTWCSSRNIHIRATNSVLAKALKKLKG